MSEPRELLARRLYEALRFVYQGDEPKPGAGWLAVADLVIADTAAREAQIAALRAIIVHPAGPPDVWSCGACAMQWDRSVEAEIHRDTCPVASTASAAAAFTARTQNAALEEVIALAEARIKQCEHDRADAVDFEPGDDTYKRLNGCSRCWEAAEIVHEVRALIVPARTEPEGETT